MENEIRIYKFEHKDLDVWDFYAADSLGSAKTEFLSDTGETEEFFNENIEHSVISESELATLQLLKNDDGKETESFQTALEQLINEGAIFPRQFASSEW